MARILASSPSQLITCTPFPATYPYKSMPKLPNALLYIATGCSHCPGVLDALGQLIKEGKIGRLEVINLTQQPELAPPGVRSVPWCRIGTYELTGAQRYADLARWAEAGQSGSDQGDYYTHLLESGELDKTIDLIRHDPDSLNALIPLLATLETPMAVRIGIGAVLEEIGGEGLLSSAISPLVDLTRSELPQVRADACHYLGLSNDRSIIPTLQNLTNDPDPEVREIALESIETLETGKQ